MPATAWSDFSMITLQGPLEITDVPHLIGLFASVERQFRVTFDLRAVDFISAGALSCFVRLHNRMRPRRELPGSASFEASIRLINVQPTVGRIIRMVRLDELFEMYEYSVPKKSELPLLTAARSF
jgi:anti-anti-sigma regulatory factor